MVRQLKVIKKCYFFNKNFFLKKCVGYRGIWPLPAGRSVRDHFARWRRYSMGVWPYTSRKAVVNRLGLS